MQELLRRWRMCQCMLQEENCKNQQKLNIFTLFFLLCYSCIHRVTLQHMCVLSCAMPIHSTPQPTRAATNATQIVLHAGGQIQLAILAKLGINLVRI